MPLLELLEMQKIKPLNMSFHFANARYTALPSTIITKVIQYISLMFACIKQSNSAGHLL